MIRLPAILLSFVVFLAQSGPDQTVGRALANPRLKDALAVVDRDHDRLVSDIITLTEIPAPPFKEAQRAAAYLDMLRGAGLTDVEQDAAGNVMGLRKGTGGGPLIAIAAHLDTVFPEGTDVRVRRNGTRLSAPGVGDNARSLAVLIAIACALDAAGIRTTGDLLFVGDVGEEGAGDLRGVKYLFSEGRYQRRIDMFISMDGGGDTTFITTAAVGSRRYRVTFDGPGGHSYAAFGLVNPAFALANLIQKLSHISVPSSPKTTFNVGVMGGGTSVNAIPSEVWTDVDLRSEQASELAKLDRQFLAAVHDAADEENRTRSTALGAVTVDLKVLGDRPSGQTPLDCALVQTAAAVVRAFGGTPAFGAGSTDANIPISLGLPAITIASGGAADRTHALDEWIDVDKRSSVRGVQNALVLLVSLAGLN